MELKTKIVPLCAGVLLLSALLCAVIYAWNEPTVAPPGDNASAPINTGGTAQTKAGGLNIATAGGNVGIGTTSPGAKLEVVGQIKITGGAPGSGKILTSNGDGLASWQIPVPSGPPNPVPSGLGGAGTANYVSKFTSSSALGNSLIFDNGANVGIGTTNPRVKLDAIGGGVLNQVAIGSAPFGSISWPYESIQLPNWANLRINFGTKQTAYFGNNGDFSVYGRGLFSRDNLGECCSSGDFTLSLAENTAGTGKKAGIQFHNGGVSEGQLRLDSGTNGRELKAYSYQDNMDVHATGYVQGDQGLCIGNDCRNSWPSVFIIEITSTFSDINSYLTATYGSTCNTGSPTSVWCASGIHRWCKAHGYKSGYGAVEYYAPSGTLTFICIK